MQKMLYFKAVRPFEGQLEGVNCRFRKDRIYEINERNPKLCAAIRAKVAAGDFVELDRAKGMDLLEAQETADRERKQAALAARAAARGITVEALMAETKVSIVTESPAAESKAEAQE